MKKKGFTLIELIGVIIILGVVTLIAMPAIRKLTSESKNELYEIQINNIKEGLKNWAIDNSVLLPKNTGESITITLGQLKMGGYVETELKNPKDNKCFSNNMFLEITRYQMNYIYTVNDETNNEITTCDDYRKPYIILNGSVVTYIEVNEEYIDKGVIAKDTNGNNITSSVTTTITGSGNIVDTSNIGNKYIITYNLMLDNEKTSINRNVIVRDSIVPQLNIPADVTLEKNVTSFNLLEGVSVTDNSGETIMVSTEGSIDFGVPGKYTIIYTAKDSSGNTAKKVRLITIKS